MLNFACLLVSAFTAWECKQLEGTIVANCKLLPKSILHLPLTLNKETTNQTEIFNCDFSMSTYFLIDKTQ